MYHFNANKWLYSKVCKCTTFQWGDSIDSTSALGGGLVCNGSGCLKIDKPIFIVKITGVISARL